MAPIYEYVCTECGFELPGGLVARHYALNKNGEKVYLSEMLGDEETSDVTGMNYWESFCVGLIGSDSDCLCFNCLETFKMDLDREQKQCPKCDSLNVKSSSGSIGSICPKCKKGKIVANMVAVT